MQLRLRLQRNGWELWNSLLSHYQPHQSYNGPIGTGPSGELQCILLHLSHGKLIWFSLHLLLVGVLMGNVTLGNNNSGQWYEFTRERVNGGSQWYGNAADSIKIGDICVTTLILLKALLGAFTPVALTFRPSGHLFSKKKHIFRGLVTSLVVTAQHNYLILPVS